MLRQSNLITIESIRYPGFAPVHEAYLPLEVLGRYPVARLGDRVLTMLARVNYGGKAYYVAFDTPTYYRATPTAW